ncbi:YraN family protein [Pleionea sediminis]|uniref:YraN family protein n=1 Tax=Pleionea sediminis TaxID=2569479 RepID=UPI001185FC4B|nr:YraN family protein [Pleionea sediminis]
MSKNRSKNLANSDTPVADSTLSTGKYFEQEAQKMLESQGLTLISKNFRTKLGEIDLIMQDSDTIVFIEVRYRKRANFGNASSTVSAEKQRKITLAANQYLTEHNLHNKKPCRFDVVSFDNKECDWVKNAFTC